MTNCGVILAAGLGTRLRPLTYDLPKALVRVAGTPMIERHLAAFREADIHSVVVNVHHLGEQIMAHVGDGGRWGVDVAYSLEPRLLGTGGALRHMGDRIRGYSHVVVVNCDLWHTFDLKTLSERAGSARQPATLLVQHHPGDGTGWVGSDAQGYLRRVPDMSVNTDLQVWAFPGLHVITPIVLEALPEGESCILRVGYRRLIEAGCPPRVYRAPTAGWFDVGTWAGLRSARCDMYPTGQEASESEGAVGLRDEGV